MTQFHYELSWERFLPSLTRTAHFFLILSIVLAGYIVHAKTGIEIQIDVVGFVSTQEGTLANLYPNPASSHISIEPEAHVNILSIEVFTSEMVLITNFSTIEQHSHTLILDPGLYYMKILTDAGWLIKSVQIVSG